MESKREEFTYDFLVNTMQDCIELTNDLALCFDSSTIDSIDDQKECPSTEFVRNTYTNTNKIIEFDRLRSLALPFITNKYSLYIAPVYTPLMDTFARRNRGINKVLEIFQDKANEYKQKIFPKLELQEELDEIIYFIDELNEQSMQNSAQYAKLLKDKESLSKKIEKLDKDPKLKTLENEIACIDPFFKVSSAIMSHINKKIEYAKDAIEHPKQAPASLPAAIAADNELINEFEESIASKFNFDDINKISDCLFSRGTSYGDIIQNSNKRSLFDIKNDFYEFADKLLSSAKEFKNILK